MMSLTLFSFVAAAVEFLGFEAYIQETRVLLSWSTATETANLGFILERKTDSLAAWNPLANHLNTDELIGQGTVSYQTDYSFIDSTVLGGRTYYYRISGIDEANNIGILDSLSIQTEPTSIAPLVPQFQYLEAYPNPFNPQTVIHFRLLSDNRVQLSIYDSRGKFIKTLTDQYFNAGEHDLVWDASNNSNGIYIIKMIADDQMISKKIILVK